MGFNLGELAEVLIKMALALVCGGILGVERERKKRPAGFRTYMLVCVGATLAMMTNQYIFELYGTGDPSRMGAQVISGIGFLGAGTIITTVHNRVKGLTTAAGLWAAASIGLALGVGFYVGAIFGTIVIFFAMVSLHRFERRVVTSTKIALVYMELDKISSLRYLLAFAKENNIELMDIETEHGGKAESSETAVVVTLKLPNKAMHAELVTKISAVTGVAYAEEI
jgi:putative Mg2+ transporter-C (MgtC) family protein